MSGLEIPKFSMTIEWSPADDAFVAAIPELRGARTHGDSYEAAAKAGQEVIELFVDGLRQEGEPIPSPRVFRAGELMNLPKANEKRAVRRAS